MQDQGGVGVYMGEHSFRVEVDIFTQVIQIGFSANDVVVIAGLPAKEGLLHSHSTSAGSLNWLMIDPRQRFPMLLWPVETPAGASLRFLHPQS